MSSGFEVGGGDELALFPQMWEDGNADWGFDNFDEQDWALWDALGGNDTTNAPDEPSSSATFHTASSPRPPPRLSPEPPRRHAPSPRVNGAALTEQSRRLMGANSSTPNPPTQPSRSPRNEHRSVPRRRRAPTPVHREDWLDRAATRRANNFGYLTENLFTPSGASSPSFDSAEFDDAIDIDDILTNVDTESEAENMPPNTRRRWNGESVVDLTIDSSPPSEARSQSRQPKRRKRAAQEPANGQSSKRRKGTSRSVKAEDELEVEQLDLTNEAPSAEEELAQAQTAAAVLAQQAATSASGPLKIGQRQCIICMENFTNITITACGHVYCHECLTQALLAGEKNSEGGKANCPVCRKQVSRKAKNQVIPLQFMKKEAFKGKARRGMSVLG